MEIEVKAPLASFQSIRNKVKEISGKRIFRGRQIDIYFQHPCKKFEETDETLRIRKVKDKAYLTYKGPRLNSSLKARLEMEVTVSDFNLIGKILVRLGFKPVMKIKKFRETWLIDDMHINLDDVEELGKFIEIEIISKEIEEEKILKTLEKLGIEKKKIIKETYFELKEKRKILT